MFTGESVSIQMFDGNETLLRGPETIRMISQHTFPPVPMPVQVNKFINRFKLVCKFHPHEMLGRKNSIGMEKTQEARIKS